MASGSASSSVCTVRNGAASVWRTASANKGQLVAGQADDHYDPVPHSHVVSAGYLRSWAHGKQIAMRRVGTSGSQVIGVRDAGVRKNFYRRDRPSTGEAIYDVEWSLKQCETVALPVLSDLADRWPLDLVDKGKVGQFFALQYLRGMAFRQWHENHVASILNEVRANPEASLIPHQGRTTAEIIAELEAAVTSDTYRLMRMLKLVRSVGILFTSMHWSLVEITRGRLATSDHPVVVWPISRGTSCKPRANDLKAGVIDSLEIFVPTNPLHLLLMTWRDQKSTDTLIAARGRHAATANAFVVANAHSQWFHEPDTEPWSTRGCRSALALDLLNGYSADKAWASKRRATARKLADNEARSELSNDPVMVVGEDELPADSGDT